jgi:hypothetical protein
MDGNTMVMQWGVTTLPQLECDEVDVQPELPWKSLIQPFCPGDVDIPSVP